jgi:hypothetical protein
MCTTVQSIVSVASIDDITVQLEDGIRGAKLSQQDQRVVTQFPGMHR